MYDLPSEDPEEPGLPDEFHPTQSQLLHDTFQSTVVPSDRIFIGRDINLYYDPSHTQWYKRPDWFVVLGVPSSATVKQMRWSYVIWQEQVSPFLVIELLSPGTEDEDLGQTLRIVGKPPTKWDVYEQILQIPYYVLFDRYLNQLRVFQLNHTSAQYEEIVLLNSRFWLEEIRLGLAVWEGRYQGAYGQWLRWYGPTNRWIPTPNERADQQQQQAEEEHHRAEEERQRAEEERQRAEQESQRAEEEHQRAEQEHQRAEQESQRAEQEHQRAEEERQRAEEERQRAEEERQRAEQERQRTEKLAEQLRALGVDPDFGG